MFISWVAVVCKYMPSCGLWLCLRDGDAVVLWWICDGGGSSDGGCQQYFIDSEYVGSPFYWEEGNFQHKPGGVNTGVTIAKMSFGHVCMVL